MTELSNRIVYKCDHCNFTAVHKNQVKIHEETCLKTQERKAKNDDVNIIYLIEDLDLINIEMSNFFKKYNIFTDITDFITLNTRNYNFIELEIHKKCKGIFDRTKFKIYQKLHNFSSRTHYINEHDKYNTYNKLEEDLNIYREQIKKTLLEQEYTLTCIIKDYLKDTK